MSDELELVNDGDGVAVFGEPGALQAFLAAESLPSRELDVGRLSGLLSRGSAMADAGSQIAEHSGRWVKLTDQSAKALKHGTLMKGSELGVSRAVLTDGGKISGILEIVKTPATMLANPAMLAGVAGLMAQLAMQQSMEEITQYLQVIDQKCDEILRAQKDAVLADMIGVGMAIDEAMTIRAEVGRVSEITWSKVQGSSQTILRTQGYALRQLDGLAERLESTRNIGELAEVHEKIETRAQEWLVVLARCSQLHDALAVLELDRVLDSAPHEVDDHRRALKLAKQKRLGDITRLTTQLGRRIEHAAHRANEKVLTNPFDSRSIVTSGARTLQQMAAFHDALGLDEQLPAITGRPWREAVADAKDEVLVVTSRGLKAAGSASERAYTETRGAASRLAKRVTDRGKGARRNDDDPKALPGDETPEL